jgi:hypothetical protein
MSYATPAELADALGIRLAPENQQVLQDCLDAAAAEIDRVMSDVPDWQGDTAPIASPLVIRVNVNRAVEWWKAPATYNGGIGSLDTGNNTGTLNAPTSGFGRHAAVLYALTPTGASGVA